MLGWGECHASMRTRVRSLAPTWKQSACALSTRERDSNQKISRFKTNSGAQLRITTHAILGPADAYTHVCSHVCKEEYTEKKTTPKIVLSQSHCSHEYNCYHVSSMYPSPTSVSDPYSDHVPWKQSWCQTQHLISGLTFASLVLKQGLITFSILMLEVRRVSAIPRRL